MAKLLSLALVLGADGFVPRAAPWRAPAYAMTLKAESNEEAMVDAFLANNEELERYAQQAVDDYTEAAEQWPSELYWFDPRIHEW